MLLNFALKHNNHTKYSFIVLTRPTRWAKDLCKQTEIQNQNHGVWLLVTCCSLGGSAIISENLILVFSTVIYLSVPETVALVESLFRRQMAMLSENTYFGGHILFFQFQEFKYCCKRILSRLNNSENCQLTF